MFFISQNSVGERLDEDSEDVEGKEADKKKVRITYSFYTGLSALCGLQQ